MKRLTPKERKLVELKAKGVKHEKAYREAYDVAPTTKASTAVINTNKVLSRPHVKDAYEKAMLRHDITLDTVLAPVGRGLKAQKSNEYTGEIVEDLPTQLKAAGMGIKLLGLGNEQQGTFHLHLHNNKTKYQL